MMKHLTNQEYRIAKQISRGIARQAIEKALGLTTNTLRVHLSNLCEKMELTAPNAYHMREWLKGYNHAPVASSRPPTLTRAEREVLTLRIAGKPFWQIAQIRGTALSTGLNISSHACHKIHVRKSTAPSTLAKALALFDAPPKVSPAAVDSMNNPAFF